MRSNPSPDSPTPRERVAELRRALLGTSPEAIEECLPGLAEAATRISSLDRESLAALQADLRQVKHLIEHGERLNRGLAALLGAWVSGYTASGKAAPISAAGSISIEA